LTTTGQPGIGLPAVAAPTVRQPAPADAGVIGKLLHSIKTNPNARRGIQTAGLSLLANQGGDTLQNIGGAGLRGLQAFATAKQEEDNQNTRTIQLLNQQAQIRGQEAGRQEQIRSNKAMEAQRTSNAEALERHQQAIEKDSTARTAIANRQADAADERNRIDLLQVSKLTGAERLTKALNAKVDAIMPDASEDEKAFMVAQIISEQSQRAQGAKDFNSLTETILENLIEQNAFADEPVPVTILANRAAKMARSIAPDLNIKIGNFDFNSVVAGVVGRDILKPVGVESKRRAEEAKFEGRIPESLTNIADDIKSRRGDPNRRNLSGILTKTLGDEGSREATQQLRDIAKSFDLETAEQDEFILRAKGEERLANQPPVQRTATVPLFAGSPAITIRKGAADPNRRNMFQVIDVTTNQPVVDPRSGQPLFISAEQFRQVGIQF